GAALTVTAGFRALGNSDVGAAVYGAFGVAARLHLTDELGAGSFDACGERLGITKREEDGARVSCQHEVEELRLLLQRPSDEAASDRRVAGSAELGIEPARISVTAADQTEPSGRSDGGSEPPARREGHGRGDDRMGDTELLRQPRVQSHVFGSPFASSRDATSRGRRQHAVTTGVALSPKRSIGSASAMMTLISPMAVTRHVVSDERPFDRRFGARPLVDLPHAIVEHDSVSELVGIALAHHV